MATQNLIWIQYSTKEKTSKKREIARGMLQVGRITKHETQRCEDIKDKMDMKFSQRPGLKSPTMAQNWKRIQNEVDLFMMHESVNCDNDMKHSAT